MNKSGTILLLIVSALVLCLVWYIFILPTYTITCYPHDGLVYFLKILALIIASIAWLTSLVFAIKKEYKNVFTSFILGYLLIPILLFVASDKISDYDYQNYEAKNCSMSQWTNISEHNVQNP